ncbi:ATP-binding protein, partial [Acinetobacter baumannii]
RTPLNSIDGFIHLLLRQQNLSNEQNLYLQTIRKSSAHLLALINDVLDFSKIDAGKLELETAPFDLEEAVFDVMDMLSPLAAQKHIAMAFYYADNIPQQVIGDALRFKQILTNLISNAIKFTPDGEIIVRVRMEHDDIGQCLLHFSVQDSGIGLSGTDRKKLFESFSQGDASVTRQFGGTGLGLAISKQLVHLMHGQIGFEDNQERAPTEKGSTFWFTA